MNMSVPELFVRIKASAHWRLRHVLFWLSQKSAVLQHMWYGGMIAGLFAAPFDRVGSKWARRPASLAGAQVCLFVTLAISGAKSDYCSEHGLYHAKRWAEAGFQVIVIIVCDDPLGFVVPEEALAFADGILLRANRGYDFGAWAAAINDLPDLRGAALVAISNDSTFGPFSGFAAMLERVRTSRAGLIGMTDCQQLVPHLQSYLLFFKPTALQSKIFQQFWQSVRCGGRTFVIYRYEIRLAAQFRRAGIECEVLFPTVDRWSNPTLQYWRELIGNGFPYVKVALLRDNPNAVAIQDWPTVVAGEGYDPQIIQRYLAVHGSNRTVNRASAPDSMRVVEQRERV